MKKCPVTRSIADLVVGEKAKLDRLYLRDILYYLGAGRNASWEHLGPNRRLIFSVSRVPPVPRPFLPPLACHEYR